MFNNFKALDVFMYVLVSIVIGVSMYERYMEIDAIYIEEGEYHV